MSINNYKRKTRPAPWLAAVSPAAVAVPERQRKPARANVARKQAAVAKKPKAMALWLAAFPDPQHDPAIERRARQALQRESKKLSYRIGRQQQAPARQRLPQRSAKQRVLDVLYRHARDEFFASLGIDPKGSMQVHHERGRLATLLIDQRFFHAVTPERHAWIDAHRDEARACGLLCAAGDWYRAPADAETARLRQILDAATARLQQRKYRL